MPYVMSTSHRDAPSRARVSSLLGVIGLALAGLACAEEPSDPSRAAPSEASIHDESSSGYLGRVHLVLQPQPDVLEPEPQLQLHARFVEYRGLSEDFVRARTDLPVPAWEQLVPGMCVPSESLLPAPATPTEPDDERELSMLDAGDLRIVLGEREISAPLVLVPDILPWLSGVEYGQVDDRIPDLVFAPDGTAPLSVSIDGSGDGALEAFSMTAIVPVSLTLTAAALDRGRLTIDWRPPSAVSDAIVLRLQAFTLAEDEVSEPVGEELTCLVADTGRASFSLVHLVRAGLEVEAERLRVSASRFDASKVQAGEFGEVEVFVERRTQETLPLDKVF